MSNIYERESDFGGQTIKESKKGWLVEGWSRYQGNRTGYRFLIPFEKCGVKQGKNLEEDYNDGMTNGEYLLQDYWITMDNNYKSIKILNKGYEVQ